MKKIIFLAFLLISFSLSVNAQSKNQTTSKTVTSKQTELFYLSEIKEGSMSGEGIGSILLANGVYLFELGEVKDLFNEDYELNTKYVGKKLKIFYTIQGKTKDKVIYKIEEIK